MKKLPEHAVYSDVVEGGFILPYKRKYTMKDFRELLTEWEQPDARWILLCSAVYHNTEITKKIETRKFLDLCLLGMAAL